MGCRKYDELAHDEFPEALGSPTGANSGNNDILPPHVLSPTNQSAHDDVSAVTGVSASPMTQTFAVPPHRYAGGLAVEPKTSTRHHHSSSSTSGSTLQALPKHRKNSIEMFLSQSPSQSLGGDFLKLTLDDHKLMSLHASSERAGGPNAFASGHFTLNAVPESPKKFGRGGSGSATHVRQQQPLERYGSSSGMDVQAPPLMSRSSSASSYSNYQLSPRMGSEDSWHGSQDGGQQSSSSSTSSAYYQEQSSQDYYNSAHAPQYGHTGREPLQQQPPQYHHHSQRQQQQQDHGMYRGNQHLYNSGGYSGNSRGHHAHSGQWNPNVGPASGMYMPGHPSPYQSSGGGNGSGMRGHRNSRSHYARMTPPLPEASPPHSPRKTMGGLTKQCKFFLQGHCRMGNKCKFAHQQPGAGQHLPPHLAAGNSGLGNGGGLYHQPLQLSPPHHHHHAHSQQHHHQGVDEQLGHHPFGRTPTRNSGYRQSDFGNNSGLNSVLGGAGGLQSSGLGGGISAPGLIAPGDAAGLSTALSVEDIQGRVFAMSKDQNGCRLLQEQLDYEDRKDLCDVIYRESLDHLAEMMVDPFGNYLFQKLLERVAPTKRLAIIRRVSSNLVAAALNLHGTRSVQKVVEVCATSAEVVEDESDCGDDADDGSGSASGESRRGRRTVNLPDIIVDALKDDAVRLCIDSNGNHVIQRALQFMKPEYNQFVFDAVCKECTTVGTHRHGCCVLQRCLDAANKQQKAEVIAQVEKQAMKLMQDPYGNYVVQYVLDSCTAEEAYGVIVKPLGNIFELSVQKFSSNVIEKCLEKAPERVRQSYIHEIIQCPKMHKMLQDQFANYVVQRALSVCSEEQCLQLVKSIRPHLACMKNTSGGRRITARILKRFPNMDISMDMGLSPTTDSNGAGMLYDAAAASHFQLNRLSSGGAMGYGHHHQPQPQYASHHHQYASHSSVATGGYPLAHPPGMAHSGAVPSSYAAHHHHGHHLPPQHTGGMLNDVVGSVNAAGTSRA